MKRNLLYITLSLVAILLLSGCEKTSNMVPENSLLTYASYGRIDVNHDAFDAQIVLHHYANGYGTIQFDRPITKIGYNAFSVCSGLTSITIPDTVNSIGDRAFYDCDSLTSIALPDGVTHIGDMAFYDCNNLTKVICTATTPPLGGTAMFDNNADVRIIFVPRESVELYKSAPNWNNYAKMIIGYDL